MYEYAYIFQKTHWTDFGSKVLLKRVKELPVLSNITIKFANIEILQYRLTPS